MAVVRITRGGGARTTDEVPLMANETTLAWQEIAAWRFEARTSEGALYVAHDNRLVGYPDSFGAHYRPPQGQVRLPKNTEPLGVAQSMEEAKALCEQHYVKTKR